MGEVKEPYEGGTGSLLEVVDMMCDVTEKLAGIVRKQAVLIEQERIAIFQKKEDRQKMILTGSK